MLCQSILSPFLESGDAAGSNWLVWKTFEAWFFKVQALQMRYCREAHPEHVCTVNRRHPQKEGCHK